MDLDWLLNLAPRLGTGSPEDDREIRDCFREGEFDSEEYLVEAIEKHLLTEDQRRQLFDNKLSIEKLLNGRFGDEPVVDQIFAEWNTALGFEHFRF